MTPPSLMTFKHSSLCLLALPVRLMRVEVQENLGFFLQSLYLNLSIVFRLSLVFLYSFSLMISRNIFVFSCILSDLYFFIFLLSAFPSDLKSLGPRIHLRSFQTRAKNGAPPPSSRSLPRVRSTTAAVFLRRSAVPLPRVGEQEAERVRPTFSLHKTAAVPRSALPLDNGRQVHNFSCFLPFFMSVYSYVCM